MMKRFYTILLCFCALAGAQAQKYVVTAYVGAGSQQLNCNSLSDALSSVTTSQADSALVMLNADDTLSSTITIPANVTLLVPGASEECYYDTPTADTIQSTATYYSKYRTITPYHTLTLDSGAVLNINGRMSVSSKVMAAEGGTYLTSGSPIEKYGKVLLNSGAKINVLNDARLYVWGFISGAGEVEAYSGSEIHEAFQFADMASKAHLSAIFRATQMGIFPFSQYGIQNIESQVTFHYGAQELVTTYMTAANYLVSTGNIPFIMPANADTTGMFILQDENATLVRHYDGTRNKQCYTLHGNAAIGKVVLSMLGMDVSSADYTLPLTNNMELTVSNGSKLSVDFYICLFPGCKFTEEDGAEITIGKDGLIAVYDLADCGGWIRDRYNFMPLTLVPSRSVIYKSGTSTCRLNANMVTIMMNGPSINQTMLSRNLTTLTSALTDAELDFNGSVLAKGPFLTTQSGANVHSSAGTGTLTIDLSDFMSDEAAYARFEERDSFAINPVDTTATIYSYRFVHTTSSDIDAMVVKMPSTFVQLLNADSTAYTAVQDSILAHMMTGESVVFHVVQQDGVWQMVTAEPEPTPTGLESLTPSPGSLTPDPSPVERGVYTLDGRKLDAAPGQGLYIKDGKVQFAK